MLRPRPLALGGRVRFGRRSARSGTLPALVRGVTTARRSAVVVGGGYVGTYTSYLLATEGYSVVCLERSDELATEMSYLNGGVLCPGLTWPWSNPSAFGLMAKALLPFSSGPPSVAVTPSALAQPHLWRWAANFVLEALNPSRVAANFKASHLLAAYSLRCMGAAHESGLVPPGAYRRTAVGSLQLYRTTKLRDSVASLINEHIGDLGCRAQVLDYASCVEREPVLGDIENSEGGTGENGDDAGDKEAGALAGGVLLESDSSGCIRQYTFALRDAAEALGVEFRCGSPVRGLEVPTDGTGGSGGGGEGGGSGEQGSVAAVRLESGELMHADAVVVAAGNGAERLACDVGDRLMTYPIKGYVLELPVGADSRPLRHVVLNDIDKIYVAPLTLSTPNTPSTAASRATQDRPDSQNVGMSTNVNAGVKAVDVGMNAEAVNVARMSGFAEFCGDAPVPPTLDKGRALDLMRQGCSFFPKGYFAIPDLNLDPNSGQVEAEAER
mmetsp:Transcript_36838/g.99013  ORF Transcript_36838/g.99013 Transcript_36838/m.99013 type:complete len:498 (-) Transcript_36838:382-1875(-)